MDSTIRLTDYPLFFLALSLVVLWTASRLGAQLSHRVADLRDEFKVAATATFTLLSLLIGFAFSMAVGRYDSRKRAEADEANAIAAEYLRADLLPPAGRDSVRSLLKSYLDRRIIFYETRNNDSLTSNAIETRRLRNQLWATAVAAAYPATALTGLVISGMIEVIDGEGYTQAAWVNRIPKPAWYLLFAIAVCACVMFALARDRVGSVRTLIWIFPVIVSVALFLVADIDSPRGGLIHVIPDNLLTVAAHIGS
jgi:hypothetical protein